MSGPNWLDRQEYPFASHHPALPAGRRHYIDEGSGAPKDIALRAQDLHRWEEAFPQARTLRLARVGHYVQVEAPDELGAAVEAFLGETVPA